MINLRVRTEYSFRYAFGKTKDIIKSSEEYCSITDRFNTFGHIPFSIECKKQGKKAILGVELAFVQDPLIKSKQSTYFITLIAKNQIGLKEIYSLVTKSTKQKYYINRLSFKDLEEISQNVIIITTEYEMVKFINNDNYFYGVSPTTIYSDLKEAINNIPLVAISDNLYDSEKSKISYEIIMGKTSFENRMELSHILSEQEWKQEIRYLNEDQKNIAIKNTYKIAESIEQFEFAKADLPVSKNKLSLHDLSILERDIRGIDKKWNDKYQERFLTELDVIEKKNFSDYFFLVHDLVKYAKQHMLVGAARGSSAGSLICYMLGITEVDPIEHGLIFERFIDINRGGYRLNKDFIKTLISDVRRF